MYTRIPTEVYGANVIGNGTMPFGESKSVNGLVAASEWAPFGSAPDYGFSSPTYHAARLEMNYGGTISNHTITTVNFSQAEFTFDRPNDAFMPVSGISYFIPLTAAGLDAFTIHAIEVEVDPVGANDPWEGCYRTDDLGFDPAVWPSAPPALLSSPNPAFISIAPFSFGTDSGIPTYDASFTPLLSDPDKARQGRIEFPFTLCGTHGGNPFSMTNAPDAGDLLEITLGIADPDITLLGDLETPAFSSDAAPRVFLRRPFGHLGWRGSAQPWWDDSIPASVVGHGEKLDYSDGRLVLFHSTRFTAPATGKFGNFVDGGGAPYTCLFTQDKDTGEKFLDEVYRWRTLFNGILPAPTEDYLLGPGMVGWGAGPLAFPVRPETAIGATWKSISWIWMGDFSANLATQELQVAGLPERNPPIIDWVTTPFPSAGILRYPAIDYTSGYAPDFATEGVTQFDYSVKGGYRGYVRAFDAAFSHYVAPPDLTPIPAAGQPFVTFRIDGLCLEDFAYQPGDIAWINQTLPGIYIKVPGLTTWLHLGRPDGAGPSKQDPLLDEAGCQVIGPYTFNGIDNTTGMVYCQVQVNVGPAANLAVGVGTEVPVLVRVIMPEYGIGEWDLTNTYDSGTMSFGDPTGPGIRGHTIRGLTGIKILYPTQIETAPVP
jgi:hypothetical protein